MSIREFLKVLRLEKLADKININLVSINIVKDDHSKKVYTDNSKNLTVNIQELDTKENKALQQFLFSSLEQNHILLERNSKILLEDFQKNEASDNTQKILDFLKPKIPPEDLNIWRAALYLRKFFKTEEKDKTRQLKYEIMQKYGDKGRNIANLCTAGYLETFLIPLYDVLLVNYKNESLAIANFTPTYNSIVKELPFTVFVCIKMKKEEIEKQIEIKKKYGLKFLNIHGIGDANVKRIKEVIKNLEETEDNPIKKEIKEEGKIILVKLLYQQK